MYPTFMFHLRRGPLVNVFGYGPDETVFYRYAKQKMCVWNSRYYLLKECTGNILTMIQPALDQYTFDK